MRIRHRLELGATKPDGLGLRNIYRLEVKIEYNPGDTPDLQIGPGRNRRKWRDDRAGAAVISGNV